MARHTSATVSGRFWPFLIVSAGRYIPLLISILTFCHVTASLLFFAFSSLDDGDDWSELAACQTVI